MAPTWHEIETHFNELIALEPAQQAAYLEKIRSHNPELYRQLQSLLQEDTSLHPLLSSSAQEIWQNWNDDVQLTGQHIGIYKLEKLLGKGAMGSVFLALRDDGEFDQVVALKLLRPGTWSDELLQSFKEERQTLAGLRHPHIASLFDGGLSNDGRPYFTMEYVEGMPVNTWCAEKNLSLTARLQLFLQVTDAIRYAHRRLVAHLDLKPANILVNTEGQIKLLDFGISQKLLHQDLQHTFQGNDQEGKINRYTLAYASPEQVAGMPVTTEADVYALGAVLYELLTGVHPYQEQLNDTIALKKAIMDSMPALPSLATAQSYKGQLAGDLDAICSKALQKQAADRYESVEQLADDVEAFLQNQPVSTRRANKLYRLKKYIRRNSTTVAIGSLAAVVLIATVTYYTIRLSREKEIAVKEARKSEKVAELLLQVFQGADPSATNGDSITAVELLNNGLQNISKTLENEPDLRATLNSQLCDVYRNLGQFDKADSLARDVLQLNRQLHPGNSGETAASLMALGAVLNVTGKMDSALYYLEESLRMYGTLKNTDSITFSDIYTELANIYYEKSDFQRCDSFNKVVYRIDSKLFTAPDKRLADDLQSIGTTLRKLDDFQQAETYLQQSLDMKKQLFKEPHVDIAYTMNHLGSLYFDLGNYDKALPYMASSLEQRKKIFGPVHPETLASQANLARLYRRQGKLDSSVILYEDALAKMISIFGDDHYYVSGLTMSLAGVYLDKQDYDKAEAMYRRSIMLDQKTLPEGHVNRAFALNGLGVVLTKKGAYQKALPYLEQAVALRQKNLGAGHNQTAIARQSLGTCLLALKNYTAAGAQLEKAYESLSKLPEKFHDQLGTLLQQLVTIYEQLHNDASAAHYRKLLNEWTS